MTSPALEVEGLSKRYASGLVLRDVSIRVASGELHALVGANGSGKSTLIKSLAGVVTAEPGGKVAVFGQEHPSNKMTPALARASGLRFVHQDSALIGDLTVAENLALDAEYPRRGPLIDVRAVRRSAAEVLDSAEIDCSPGTLVRQLRPAQRAQLAIERAFRGHEDRRQVIFLDEPTAALLPAEVDKLFERLAFHLAAGHAAVLVTHRLAEVCRSATRATVLRDGAVVGRLEEDRIDEDALVELITGAPVTLDSGAQSRARTGEVTVRAVGVRGAGIGPIDLDVARGEIVGLAGLVGSGRSELLGLLYGSLLRESGTVTVAGRDVPGGDIRAALDLGIRLTPEDRVARGIFAPLSVSDNVLIMSLRNLTRFALLSRSMLNRESSRVIRDFSIHAPSASAPISTLSGGNQQKGVLARNLSSGARVLLLDEPTHGVDVGARADIYQLIRDISAAGGAAVVVSSDLSELIHVCDRVYVMADGRLSSSSYDTAHLDVPTLTRMVMQAQGKASG